MLHVAPQSWGWRYSNVQSTRVTSAWGASVTPGVAPSWGAWATIIDGSAITTDVFALLVMIGNNAASATTRNALVDIGIDPAGGTSFTTIIPYLLGGHAGTANADISLLLLWMAIGGCGVWFWWEFYQYGQALIGWSFTAR